MLNAVNYAVIYQIMAEPRSLNCLFCAGLEIEKIIACQFFIFGRPYKFWPAIYFFGLPPADMFAIEEFRIMFWFSVAITFVGWQEDEEVHEIRQNVPQNKITHMVIIFRLLTHYSCPEWDSALERTL